MHEKSNGESAAEKFEIMMSQINTLEGDKAEVTWNEKIVDPDNPAQQRQIGVLDRINPKYRQPRLDNSAQFHNIAQQLK